MAYTVRLKERYRAEIVAELTKQFEYKNVMQVPRLLKISHKKVLDDAIQELRAITGQHPVTAKAKKSVSNFKLREGMPIGVHVTLRGNRMYEFFDRLVTLALPRVRDFRGVPDKSFDGRGNYSLGIKEQIIFPEINVDKIDQITGLDITFVTSAGTDEEAFALLKAMGMPFVRRETEEVAI